MLNGILLCDKPTGITSHTLINILRRRLGQKQIGHAGTLDPLATGLMVVLLGEATKLSDYVLNDNKAYEVEATFGLETDSWDSDGEILKDEDFAINESSLKQKLSEMDGELQLQVPQYSAVKKNGKKLYELARENKIVEVPTRPMTFWGLEHQITSPKTADFRFSCSKGSFVRSWVMEMGYKMGTVATVTRLRRLRSGSYLVENALSPEQVETIEPTNFQSGNLSAFIPLSECLADKPAVRVKGKNRRLLENGQIPHELSRHLMPEQKQVNKLKNQHQKGQIYRVFNGENHSLLALMEMRPCRPLKIKRVFKPLDA